MSDNFNGIIPSVTFLDPSDSNESLPSRVKKINGNSFGDDVINLNPAPRQKLIKLKDVAEDVTVMEGD